MLWIISLHLPAGILIVRSSSLPVKNKEIIPLLRIIIMEEIIQAIILGLTQGLTEFLPVSSSGHLVLMREILGADFGTSSLLFDVLLHFGTLVSLLVVFFKDFINLFKPPFKTLGLLLLASVPAVIVGLLLDDYFEVLQTGKFVCFAFLFTAIVLFVTEIITKKRLQSRLAEGEEIDKPITWKTALIMGGAQAVAILPGVSRSGSTICAGVISGSNRKEVAKFSFFMSAIVIAGSALLTAFDLITEPETLSISAWAIVAGVVSAMVSGFFAVKLMMKLIEKSNYKWFSLYLVIVGIITFVDAYVVNFI